MATKRAAKRKYTPARDFTDELEDCGDAQTAFLVEVILRTGGGVESADEGLNVIRESGSATVISSKTLSKTDPRRL